MGIGRVSYPTMRIKSPSNDVKSCFKVGSVVIGSRYPILAARFRLEVAMPYGPFWLPVEGRKYLKDGPRYRKLTALAERINAKCEVLLVKISSAKI